MLNNAAYSEDVGRRLHGVAAEIGRLAGWLAYESNQPAAAQRYFMAALRAAHVSGDRAIGANILGFMSLQASESDSPRDAVTLAESALAPGRELSLKGAAFLYGQLAVGAAYAGGAATCRQAQREAATQLARPASQDEPPWIYWFTADHVHGIAGRCQLALGNPAEAERHLRAMVATFDPTFARDRALWLCDLATARVGAGSVEQACATATEAAVVIRRLDSPRDKRRLGNFRRAAAPYAKSAAVRDFDAKYRDLAEPSPA